MYTIAIVEDNEAIREAVVSYLNLEDYSTVEFPGCTGVLEHLNSNDVDLLLLDVVLPDGNGFYLGKEIRKASDVPIIFMTSKNTESDRIMGFEIGGDDFVEKPFSIKELMLRINALLRRANRKLVSAGAGSLSRKWRLNNYRIEIDFPGHELFVDNENTRMTATEWKILTYLVSNEHVVVSREQILDHSLEYNFEGYDRIVDTHIKNIRAKLGKGEWIETVRGYGYRFCGTPSTD